MIRRGALLFGLVCWAMAPALSAQDKNLSVLVGYSSLSGHIEKAKAAFQRDNLAACEKEALFCLARLPEHHEAHFLMSQILYKKGEFEKALEHIQAAESGFLKLNDAVSLLEQQKIKRQMDNVGDLIDDVKDATAADDAARARASCQINKYDTAVHDAKEKLLKEERGKAAGQSETISPIPAAYHFAHGNNLFRLRRLPEAEAEYLLVIKADPGQGQAYNNLINLLFAQGRLDEARALLSQAEAHKVAVHPGLKKAVLEASGK